MSVGNIHVLEHWSDKNKLSEVIFCVFWHWLLKESVMRPVVSCSLVTACIQWQQPFSSFISSLIFVVWRGWKEQRNKTSFCPWRFLFQLHWISCVSVLSYMLKLLDWLYHFWEGNRHGKALYMCWVCNWARALGCICQSTLKSKKKYWLENVSKVTGLYVRPYTVCNYSYVLVAALCSLDCENNPTCSHRFQLKEM